MAVPLNVVLLMWIVSVRPAWVEIKILSVAVIDPISASSMITNASVSAVPCALRFGEESTVNVPSVLDVVPVWYFTNNLAASPVAADFIVTVSSVEVATTVLSKAVLASMAAATLAAVIVPVNATVVYWFASSVVVLISMPCVVVN